MIYIQSSLFDFNCSVRARKDVLIKKLPEILKEQFPNALIKRPGMRDSLGFLREDGLELGVKITKGHTPKLDCFYKGTSYRQIMDLQSLSTQTDHFLDWLQS